MAEGNIAKQKSFLRPGQEGFSLPREPESSLEDVNQPFIPGEGHDVDLHPPVLIPIGQVYENEQGHTFTVRKIRASDGKTTRAGVRELSSRERSAY